MSTTKDCAPVRLTACDESVTLSKSTFEGMLRLCLSGSDFDEAFYLSENQDVRDAVESGVFDDGLDHFVQSGLFEGRLPCPIVVDEDFYLQKNRDVEEAIWSGEFASAGQHYHEAGRKEHRLPFASFLFYAPKVSAENSAKTSAGEKPARRARMSLFSGRPSSRAPVRRAG